MESRTAGHYGEGGYLFWVDSMSLRPAVVSLLVIALGAEGARGAERPVRVDSYGDPLPPGVRFRLGTLRLRHTADVLAVAWLPDGRRLASVGMYKTLRLWQIPDGKRLGQWDIGEAPVFSRDGRTLAYMERGGGAVHLFDVDGGKELRRMVLPGCPAGFSADGKVLALVEGKGIRLYAVDSGKKLRFLEGKVQSCRVYPSVVFSPDGLSLLSTTEKGICAWNMRTGATQYPLGEEAWDSFAFSPDGKMLAVAVAGTLQVATWWNRPEGKELRQLDVEDDNPEALAFSPDGKILAASNGETICLWDVASGRQLRRLGGHHGSWGLAFSPDGSLLASAGRDSTVNVWEVRPGKTPPPLTGTRYRLENVDWTADGKALVTQSADGTRTLWDGRDGRKLCTLPVGEESANRLIYGADVSRTRALLWQDVENGRHPPGFTDKNK